MIVVVEGWWGPVHSRTPKQTLEVCVEPFPTEMDITDSIFIELFI